MDGFVVTVCTVEVEIFGPGLGAGMSKDGIEEGNGGGEKLGLDHFLWETFGHKARMWRLIDLQLKNK